MDGYKELREGQQVGSTRTLVASLIKRTKSIDSHFRKFHLASELLGHFDVGFDSFGLGGAKLFAEGTASSTTLTGRGASPHEK